MAAKRTNLTEMVTPRPPADPFTPDLPERLALRGRRKDTDRLSDDQCRTIFRALPAETQARLTTAAKGETPAK